MTAAATLTCAIGCGSVPALPESFEVATSATDRVTADAGTGPAALADSVWSLARKPDPSDANDNAALPPRSPYGGLLNGQGLERPPVGERMFLAHFEAEGELTEITENRFFLARIYGSRVPVGGEWNASNLPGIAFRSDSYGVQAEERFGLAAVAHVRFGNVFLGRAVLYSWGTVADDLIDGVFGYLLDFTDGLLSQLGTVADQYPIDGQRVEP